MIGWKSHFGIFQEVGPFLKSAHIKLLLKVSTYNSGHSGVVRTFIPSVLYSTQWKYFPTRAISLCGNSIGDQKAMATFRWSKFLNLVQLWQSVWEWLPHYVYLQWVCILVSPHSDVITLFLFLIRAFAIGVFQAVFVYTPEVYPTSVRAAAMGFCSASSRIGGIITPFIAQV